MTSQEEWTTGFQTAIQSSATLVPRNLISPKENTIVEIVDWFIVTSLIYFNNLFLTLQKSMKLCFIYFKIIFLIYWYLLIFTFVGNSDISDISCICVKYIYTIITTNYIITLFRCTSFEKSIPRLRINIKVRVCEKCFEDK